MLFATLPPQSNRADWIEAIEIRDDDDNDLIDLTGCEIILTVKDEDGCQVLTGSTADGSIVIVSTGVAEFSFPRSRMANLRADTYEVGGTLSRDGDTMQFLIGQLPVVDGVVTR
jgi:hypothetical protein